MTWKAFKTFLSLLWDMALNHDLRNNSEICSSYCRWILGNSAHCSESPRNNLKYFVLIIDGFGAQCTL